MLTADVWYTFCYVSLQYLLAVGMPPLKPKSLSSLCPQIAGLVSLKLRFLANSIRSPKLTFLFHFLTHILASISLCTTFPLFQLAHIDLPIY